LSHILIFPFGRTAACHLAALLLERSGILVTNTPTAEVTHLLLDVPSFRPNTPEGLSEVLAELSEDITVIGGNLEHECLASYRKLDLLKEEAYIARNAAITADCAIRFAAPLLSTTFADTPTLIIGWGRIGKCLSRLLRALDCPVTVAVRSGSDRCILNALGYATQNTSSLDLRGYRLLFNTAPEIVLTSAQLDCCPELIKVELASCPGLTGESVHIARGLPGVLAPESSGKLIAATILDRIKEETP